MCGANVSRRARCSGLSLKNLLECFDRKHEIREEDRSGEKMDDIARTISCPEMKVL